MSMELFGFVFLDRSTPAAAVALDEPPNTPPNNLLLNCCAKLVIILFICYNGETVDQCFKTSSVIITNL